METDLSDTLLSGSTVLNTWSTGACPWKNSGTGTGGGVPETNAARGVPPLSLLVSANRSPHSFIDPSSIIDIDNRDLIKRRHQRHGLAPSISGDTEPFLFLVRK
jgi:hypothetical protein